MGLFDWIDIPGLESRLVRLYQTKWELVACDDGVCVEAYAYTQYRDVKAWVVALVRLTPLYPGARAPSYTSCSFMRYTIGSRIEGWRLEEVYDAYVDSVSAWIPDNPGFTELELEYGRLIADPKDRDGRPMTRLELIFKDEYRPRSLEQAYKLFLHALVESAVTTRLAMPPETV